MSAPMLLLGRVSRSAVRHGRDFIEKMSSPSYTRPGHSTKAGEPPRRLRLEEPCCASQPPSAGFSSER
jgi:hypothetical protein